VRRNFPDKVKALAFERARGHCEKCSARLYVGKFAYDHVLADALGGEPILSNCEVLCSACHGVKTRRGDVPAIAKVKRVRARHIGVKKQSSFPKPPAGSRWDWKLGRRVFTASRGPGGER
jgi:5-methylcytosine-specific restriction endonuclease McrA